jgi:hypothetical protein
VKTGISGDELPGAIELTNLQVRIIRIEPGHIQLETVFEPARFQTDLIAPDKFRGKRLIDANGRGKPGKETAALETARDRGVSK